MAKTDKERRRERMKQRQERSKEARRRTRTGGRVLDLSKATGDDILWYRPSQRNLIDIIPFVIGTSWYPELRGFDGKRTGLEVGDLEYKLEVPVHPRIGPEEVTILCLKEAFGKKCFICEQRSSLDWKEDEVEMRALTPKWRVFYNIIDLLDDENEREVKLWEVSYHLFEKDMIEELEEEEDEREETILLADLEQGHRIKFRGTEKKIPPDVTFLEFKSFDFKKRKDPYSEDVLEKSHPLDSMLVIPTYEDGQKTFLGLEEEEEEREEGRETDTVKPPTTMDDKPPGEIPVDLEDRLEEMGKDDLLEFIEEKQLRIRGAKRKKPKELRQLIQQAVRGEASSEEEKEEVGETHKCPSGYKFGQEVDENPECDSCDIWQECADEQDKRRTKTS